MMAFQSYRQDKQRNAIAATMIDYFTRAIFYDAILVAVSTGYHKWTSSNVMAVSVSQSSSGWINLIRQRDSKRISVWIAA
jgi:hypothetical protein